MVLKRNPITRKAREIRVRIDRQLDLWERGKHAGLVGDALAEGRAREGRIERRKEEEEDCLAHSFQSTLLLGKLRKVVHQATECEGEGGVFSRGTSAGRPSNR